MKEKRLYSQITLGDDFDVTSYNLFVGFLDDAVLYPFADPLFFRLTVNYYFNAVIAEMFQKDIFFIRIAVIAVH